MNSIILFLQADKLELIQDCFIYLCLHFLAGVLIADAMATIMKN